MTKEFGIRLKDEEICNIYSIHQGKSKCTTQEFLLINNDVEDYKPFLRIDSVYMPIKYTRLITRKCSRIVEFTQFKEGEKVSSNEFISDDIKTIQFVIDEL